MIMSTASGLWYAEHENLNSYRNYPFSETSDTKDKDGAELAADVFVDAMVYPVVPEPTGVRLTELRSDTGEVFMECGSGDTLSGSWSDGSVELYDGMGRHSGTLVCGPGWEREATTGRRRTFENLWLSAAVCCPVVHDGVIGMTDEDGSWRTSRKNLVMSGDGLITPVLTDTDHGPELRFDAQYAPNMRPRSVINQVVVAVCGRTVFDVAQVDDGTVEVYATDLDREDICWQAHKEDAVSVVVDACAEQEECPTPLVTSKAGVVPLCPTDVGNVILAADDGVNYKNPIKISVVDGETSAQRPQITDGMSQAEMLIEARKTLDRPLTAGNAIMISMPGL